MANLRQALYAWRDAEAAKRSAPLYRILPSSALDEIVKALPRTKDELVAIKGIKEAKFQLYGKTILAIVDEHVGERLPKEEDGTERYSSVGAFLSRSADAPRIFSVSDYLDVVNNTLWRLSASVKGEVTSLKFQGSALYLTIKDAADESTLRVFMWVSDFELSGIELREGLFVVVSGKSEVYKPTGGFSFRAQSMELAGEGAIVAAYLALKKKLTTEGVFAPERKRPLPEFPEKIGLITSREGAVIHDFLNNLGRFGFRIRFVDSRVEGAVAVKELLRAIRTLEKADLDVLVLIRGGGSLESLQAFNNEHVVRAIAAFPAPVICAIGHDKDVPLAQLAADFAPSTPTACTALVNAPWEEARGELRLLSRELLTRYASTLMRSEGELRDSRSQISEQLLSLERIFSDAAANIRALVSLLMRVAEGYRRSTQDAFRGIVSSYRTELDLIRDTLVRSSEELRLRDPLRQLHLGYSILSRGGKVLRSLRDVALGEHLVARLSDGTLRASVEEILPD